VEGMRGGFASPHPRFPARGGQAAWRNTHGPPAAGGQQPVGGGPQTRREPFVKERMRGGPASLPPFTTCVLYNNG